MRGLTSFNSSMSTDPRKTISTPSPTNNVHYSGTGSSLFTPTSPSWRKSPSPSNAPSVSTIGSVSLLDIALSPIVGPPIYPERNTNHNNSPHHPIDANSPHHMPGIIRSNTWASPLWFSTTSSSVSRAQYQYEVSCTTASPVKRSWLEEQTPKWSFLSASPSGGRHSQSDLTFFDPRNVRQQHCRSQSVECSVDEYWEEHRISPTLLDQYTMDLRKWLHGTIIRRLMDEITSVNRHLSETYGEQTEIGSTSLNTLQQLCSSKYQYIPTLPTLLSFLEFMKDHGYLINRIRELARGYCLDEFRWDSGSRSSGWLWKEHLPNDSLILLHMFATYMDTRMPPHPKCLTGRVFNQLCVVRHPDKPDLKSKYNTQLYQVAVQPPQFNVVLDGKVYTIPPGPKNLYHAILMCFHHATTVDGKFRSISLGSSGLNLAWIFAKK